MSSCPTPVVVFSYAGWQSRYPEFNDTVTPDIAAELFLEACLYCDNTPCSVICDIPTRTMLLNMVVAHLAQMYFGTGDDAPSSLVGRITNATQGSISVVAEMPNQPQGAAWWQQTKYGASFWAATGIYRKAMYLPNPARPVDPFWPNYYWVGGLPR